MQLGDLSGIGEPPDWEALHGPCALWDGMDEVDEYLYLEDKVNAREAVLEALSELRHDAHADL